MQSTPKSSRALAILILVSVSKKAFANCSPSAFPKKESQHTRQSTSKRKRSWEPTSESALDDLEAADIGEQVFGTGLERLGGVAIGNSPIGLAICEAICVSVSSWCLDGDMALYVAVCAIDLLHAVAGFGRVSGAHLGGTVVTMQQ